MTQDSRVREGTLLVGGARGFLSDTMAALSEARGDPAWLAGPRRAARGPH